MKWLLAPLGNWLARTAEREHQLDKVTLERDEALARVTELEAEVERLRPPEQPEWTVWVDGSLDILTWLFSENEQVSHTDLMSFIKYGIELEDPVAKYHLDKLIEAKYVKRAAGEYIVTRKGRAFIVENGLE